MKIWPVLIDSEPAYIRRSSGKASLLLTPTGAHRLVTQLCEELERVTADVPTIVAPPGAGADYRTHMSGACPSAVIALTADDLSDILATAEASDLVLFVDPRCLPVNTRQLSALMDRSSKQPQLARHLVAAAADIAGTRECVNVDGNGHVRSVHRYYKATTWPFIGGVAASMVPVSSGILPLSELPSSLSELRQQLASRGVPSRDLTIQEGAFDLAEEHGLLSAMEQWVRQTAGVARAGDASGPVLLGSGHEIHPSARLLGPIVVHPNVRIDARATVVGPTLIGEGCHIGAGAVVAHAVLGAGSTVPDGRVVRDRVGFGHVGEDDQRRADTRPLFYQQRLPRLASDESETPSAPPSERPGGPLYPSVKRAIDATLAALSLFILSPILAFVAVLIKLDSKGPVFFTHTREGLDGELFNCLKLRTMAVGANSLQRQLKAQDILDGPHFKMASDPRTTRVGRLLRATNIDELPQLVNVLLGDMSLVGPRPSPFRENQICVPWRNGRLSVRPGITGLWQVCRQDRASGDFHQWIEYDLLYVQHMSLLTDLKVLAATVFTLGGKSPVPVSWMVPVRGRIAPTAPETDKRRASGAASAPSPLMHAEGSGRSAQ